MAKKFSLPRGTADILPENVGAWQAIEEAARQTMERYGYREIRTPAFEETNLFSRSLGQMSDIVQKQMLGLAKDGLALRPEGTASIVRSYIENSIDKKIQIAKLYYIGAMFRGERPQKGRLRQFHQIGVEAMGPGTRSAYLDAEVISLSVNLLKAFGLAENDFQLKINTLGTLDDKEQFGALLVKKLKPKLRDLCEDCQRRFTSNPFRVLDCKNRQCKSVVGALQFGSDWLSAQSRQYFTEVKDALTSLGIVFDERPDLVRGLDYYTGVVFELSSSSLGSQDALGAGGRYDTLTADLGGSTVDAVGFALGVERILLAVSKKKIAREKPLTTYLIALDEKSFKRSFQMLNILRADDVGIASDMSYRKDASLKSAMRLADKIGTRSVIVIGENELKQDSVIIKDMSEKDESKKGIAVTIQDGDYSFLIDELRKLEERYA